MGAKSFVLCCYENEPYTPLLFCARFKQGFSSVSLPLRHFQTVYQQCPIIYVRKTQLLVSQLLHITPLAHFSEHPMNFQFEAITTTNINFQILHCQVHSFEARLTLILG